MRQSRLQLPAPNGRFGRNFVEVDHSSVARKMTSLTNPLVARWPTRRSSSFLPVSRRNLEDSEVWVSRIYRSKCHAPPCSCLRLFGLLTCRRSCSARAGWGLFPLELLRSPLHQRPTNKSILVLQPVARSLRNRLPGQVSSSTFQVCPALRLFFFAVVGFVASRRRSWGWWRFRCRVRSSTTLR